MAMAMAMALAMLESHIHPMARTLCNKILALLSSRCDQPSIFCSVTGS
jgi:hypothetical protein